MTTSKFGLGLLVSGCLAVGASCADDDGASSGTDTDGSTSAGATSASSTTSTSAGTTTSTSGASSTTSSSPSTGADSDTTGSEACPVPNAWSAPDWASNTADQATARMALADLTGTVMAMAEANATAVALADLTTPYEAGTPSLSSITQPGIEDLVTDIFNEFVSVTAAGEQDLVTIAGSVEWTPGADGGLWGDGNRGFNEGGLEIRQVLDKALFSGGAFYFHAQTLTEGTIDEATIDQIAYIWGGNAAMDPTDEVDALADSAAYAYEQGYFAESVAALTAAKAHAANDECAAERDAALVEFFGLWEEAMMSRFAYYMAETAALLSTASTQTNYSDALHQASEGIGLAVGFYGLPAPRGGPLGEAHLRIDDAELETMLGHMRVDLSDLGASTHGEFTENLADFEDGQDEAEAVLMTVYGIDAAVLATWRTPTPG